MIRVLATTVLSLVLLSACSQRRGVEIELPSQEVPSPPYLQAIDARRQAFASLEAVAHVQARRSGKKQSFESVAILVRAHEKLKVEAYGPTGQPVLELLWNGNDVLVWRPDDSGLVSFRGSDLTQPIGVALAAEDLGALLSGNTPEIPEGTNARTYCGSDDRCVVVFRKGDRRWLVQVKALKTGSSDAAVTAFEEYRGEKLIHRARFDQFERDAAYLLPKRIILDQPGQRTSLTVEYEDVEINVPVPDTEFSLSRGETRSR